MSAPASVRFTRKGNDFYAICCQWLEKPLVVKGRLLAQVKGVSMLGLIQKI